SENIEVVPFDHVADRGGNDDPAKLFGWNLGCWHWPPFRRAISVTTGGRTPHWREVPAVAARHAARIQPAGIYTICPGTPDSRRPGPAPTAGRHDAWGPPAESSGARAPGRRAPRPPPGPPALDGGLGHRRRHRRHHARVEHRRGDVLLGQLAL